jgi:Ca2+-binding EF-hand superfamily protein
MDDPRLRELFDEIDLNHDGELDGNELVLAMHRLGCPLCEDRFVVAKFSGILAESDVCDGSFLGINGKTTITYTEFCDIIQAREVPAVQTDCVLLTFEKKLNKIYNALDLDGNDQLELRELEEALAQYTEYKFTSENIKKMFELIQKNSVSKNTDFV